MATRGGYSIGDIYQGGYSSLNPSYGSVFTGYRVAASELGANTKPDTANQIQQVNQLLNQGIVPIEITTLQPQHFDQIPKQHFKEINRMAKLTGAKVSLHSPLIDATGIGEQGWSETNREMAERQLSDVINKAVDLDDENNVPVVIHASNYAGSEWIVKDGQRKRQRLIAINKETGKMAPFEEDKKYSPGGEVKEEIWTPERKLESANATEWDNSLFQVEVNRENVERIMQDVSPIYIGKYIELRSNPHAKQNLSDQESAQINKIHSALEFAKQGHQTAESLFSKAYEDALERNDTKTIEVLKETSKRYGEMMGIDKDKGSIKDATKYLNPVARSQALSVLYQGLDAATPQSYVPVEEFAINKSSKTFANVAVEAYKKYKDKAPTLAIENLYSGMAFSSGEDMDKLITESKNKFVERAVQSKDKGGLGMSKSAAQKQADKMIGMTLDVGHLNISKKQGFKDKDLMKEVEQIAKHVKHVHLTDNFGYSDSHLPPGMGNVPIKEIMERLDKENFKGTKIVEAGGWVQHFGTSPLMNTLEGMGSPIYAEGPAPYWNQASGLTQGYFGGYGMMLPQKNYETFGAGFSMLPAELGGQVQGGAGGRMGGGPGGT